MSGDKRPPYHRRTTKPIPRAELAPPASHPDLSSVDPDEVMTLVPCPCCSGVAMVTPAKAAEVVSLMTRVKETA